MSTTNGGPSYYEWPAAELAVTVATRGGATLRELESGYSVTIAGKVAREARKAASAAKRAWAACLRKIFEVDPVRCGKCGGGMKLVSVILDDRELDRIARKSYFVGLLSPCDDRDVDAAGPREDGNRPR